MRPPMRPWTGMPNLQNYRPKGKTMAWGGGGLHPLCRHPWRDTGLRVHKDLPAGNAAGQRVCERYLHPYGRRGYGLEWA